MGLATWDQPLDRYDYKQLSNNWQVVDFHDHSPGRGVPISTNGIAPGSITIPLLNGTLAQSAGLNTSSLTTKGSFAKSASDTFSVTAFPSVTSSLPPTTTQAPDQVSGITLPTNGIIVVWYHATWLESTANAGSADIFIGANQLRQYTGTASPALSPASNGAAVSTVLGSYFGGLASADGFLSVGGPNYAGDVTTGQVIGGAGVRGLASGTGSSSVGGPCYIFAAAGTYTISVQFCATSGHTVTASNRKLWVAALDFV